MTDAERREASRKFYIKWNNKGNTKKIDAYIPETKIIIEQKSLGIDLEEK